MKQIIVAALLLTSDCLAFVPGAEASGLCCQLSSGVQESLAGVTAPGTAQASLLFNYSFTRMDSLKEGGVTKSLAEARHYKKSDGTSYTSLPLSMAAKASGPPRAYRSFLSRTA